MPRTAATTVSSTTPPVAGSFDPARLRHPLEKRVEAIVTAVDAILVTAIAGFLFWGTTLTSNAAARTVYLGRPWHPGGDANARGQVLYRGVTMGAHIRNDPWTDMSGFSWKTARFAEYSSTGAGAAINADRPQLSASTVTQFTPTAYLAGADAWNPIR